MKGESLIDVAEYKVIAPEPVTTKRKLSYSANVDALTEVLRLVRSEDFQEQLKLRPNERDELVNFLAPKTNVLLLLDCTGESMPRVIVNSKSELTKDEINALRNSNPTSRAEYQASDIPGYDVETDEFDESVWVPAERDKNEQYPKIKQNGVEIMLAFYNE